MSLDLTIIKPGEPVLASAKNWNTFARHVNSLWDMRAGPGVKITKGEPWLIEYEGGDEPITTWFNDQCVRVYVWRNDAWDYGSAAPPLAFFVSGSFTTLNGLGTSRLAKVVKGSTGASARSTAFCNQVDFTGPTAFFSKNKANTNQLFVGTQGLTQYHGDYNGNAHLLNWQTGALDPSYTSANSSFPSTAMVGIASIGSRFLIHDYYTLFSTNLAGTGVVSSASTDMNMHSIVNDGASAWLSCAWTTAGGYAGANLPQGLRKLNGTGTQISAWNTTAGTGSDCAAYFGALPNLALWNAGDTNVYVPASLETGASLSWNGTAFGSAIFNCAIMKVSSAGVIQGLPLGIVSPGNDRASVFCKSPAGEIWLGSAVNELHTATIWLAVDPYQLYKYNEATDTVTYFPGFDGAVYDCQWFSTVGGVQQFIVVGNFTTYNGDPAERIVFIDQNGTRLPDLIWP